VGVIVPLVKDKSSVINDSSNYRAITLAPVISKVFESIVLHICDDALATFKRVRVL